MLESEAVHWSHLKIENDPISSSLHAQATCVLGRICIWKADDVGQFGVERGGREKCFCPIKIITACSVGFFSDPLLPHEEEGLHSQIDTEP